MNFNGESDHKLGKKRATLRFWVLMSTKQEFNGRLGKGVLDLSQMDGSTSVRNLVIRSKGKQKSRPTQSIYTCEIWQYDNTTQETISSRICTFTCTLSYWHCFRSLDMWRRPYQYLYTDCTVTCMNRREMPYLPYLPMIAREENGADTPGRHLEIWCSVLI